MLNEQETMNRTLIAALVAIVCVVPYSMYVSSSWRDNFFQYLLAGLVGSASTIIFYKLFAENTVALKRRLERVQKLEKANGKPVSMIVSILFIHVNNLLIV